MVWRMRVFGSKDGGYFSCLVKNYLDTIVVGSGESLTIGLSRGDLGNDYIQERLNKSNPYPFFDKKI